MENKNDRRTITMHGNPLPLKGNPVQAGDRAQDFTAVKQDTGSYEFFKETEGKIKIISVVPSVDTSVCALQTQRFNREAAGLSGDVAIVTISVDLPFALGRFCAAEGIQNIAVVSDHRTLDFGEKYGFVIEELRLLSRGIVLVDRDNVVRYVEYVGEVSQHPDYDRVLAEVKGMV